MILLIAGKLLGPDGLIFKMTAVYIPARESCDRSYFLVRVSERASARALSLRSLLLTRK